VESANRWTGLNQLSGEKNQPTAISQTFVDTTTAFLHSQLTGRPAWLVTYPEFEFALDSVSIKKVGRPHWRADVWLDSATSELLLIELRPADTPSIGFRMPTVAEAEDQLGNAWEKYYGLPVDPPGISLLEALQRYSPWPLLAKQVLVQYLMYSRGGGDPYPAWVVYLRGTPGFRPPGVDKYVPHQTQSARRVFNAVTGAATPETNLPVPVSLTSDSGRQRTE